MSTPVPGVVREVGPGCFAWLRLPGTWGETNIGLVTGEGSSLLIDTPWDPPLTRAMLDAFAPQLEKAPVSLVFNTHPDVDHWWGNALLPNAEVLASANAAAAMHEEASPAQMLAMRQFAQRTAWIPGRPGRVGRYVSQMLAPFALGDVTLRFPDRSFTKQRSETVGGREVEFIDYGSAHTESDCVVLVPDARVVYTGDLLFSAVTPIMWHGPVDGWLSALEAIIELDADVFVAGHGDVSTRAELRTLHGYWAWLRDAVQAHRAQGIKAKEMTQRLLGTPEFAAFSAWPAAERLFVNVATIDRQLAGKGRIPANPVGRTKAFDGIAGIAHALRH